MTITAISRNDAIGNDATAVYPYGFKIFSASHLLVTVRDLAGGETVLTLTTHYTVSGVGLSAGGNVTLVNGGFNWQNASGFLKAGYAISTRRVVPVLQATDVRNAGGFFPDTHEDAFDYQMMVNQQSVDQLARSLKLPETEPGSSALTTIPFDRASKLLGFDASKNPVALTPTGAAAVMTTPIGVNMVNGYLDWSVSGNALSCAIKTMLGADPSITDPVYIWMLPSDITGEPPVLVEITSAKSVTVPQGATLGAINNEPLRVWALLLKAASGAVELGVVNCVNIVKGALLDDYDIRHLRPGFDLTGTLAVGTGSDSNQIIYTPNALSDAQYAVLGNICWEDGLPAVGVWDVAPTNKALYFPGYPLPGDRIRQTRSTSGGVATGTGVIPLDDTVPTDTEGDEYASCLYARVSPCNILEIEAAGYFSHSAAGAQIIAAVGRQPSALAVTVGGRDAAANTLCHLHLKHQVFAPKGSAGVSTWWLRAGGSIAGTLTINGQSGGRLFGGGLPSFLMLTEIQT